MEMGQITASCYIAVQNEQLPTFFSVPMTDQIAVIWFVILSQSWNIQSILWDEILRFARHHTLWLTINLQYPFRSVPQTRQCLSKIEKNLAFWELLFNLIYMYISIYRGGVYYFQSSLFLSRTGHQFSSPLWRTPGQH